jgi:hypothetical protein
MSTDHAVRPAPARPEARRPRRRRGRVLQIVTAAAVLIGGFAVGSVWMIVVGLLLAGTSTLWAR